MVGQSNPEDQRVSLDPLDPETALRALLAVSPGDQAEEAEDQTPRT